MFDTIAMRRTRRIRALKDQLVRKGIVLGGAAVIVAVLLIFFYLLWEVMPLFRPASIHPAGEIALPATASKKTLYLSVEEQNELAARLSQDGVLAFFGIRDGKLRQQMTLPHADLSRPSVLAANDPSGASLAIGYEDGAVVLLKQAYTATYPDNVKTITPAVSYPLGDETVSMTEGPVQALAVNESADSLLLAAAGKDGVIQLRSFSKQENLITGAATLEEDSHSSLVGNGHVPQGLWLDSGAHFLFVPYEQGMIDVYDLRHPEYPPQEKLLPAGRRITSSHMLLGGYSLLVGDSQGTISQWFMVRDAANRAQLALVRNLSLGDAPVTAIYAEQRRKGFVATDTRGEVGFFNATAERLALKTTLDKGPLGPLALSPRGNGLLWESPAGRLFFHEVQNPHPEVSWSALWEKVWYENYDQPRYIWQSSAANGDFEPKFSLMPLAFGTLKAAFYAMLLATPLAICGAIFTAYFMSPLLRTMVKPSIELMAALPTVILGFLAGLWLAPLLELYLPGVFSVLVLMPILILLAAVVWTRMPRSVRHHIPEGLEPLLLIPVILLAVWIPFSLSEWMEINFFGGDVRQWLDGHGIPFDQRNALVVGLAMGFAVVPTIFSIAEDAIFAVPKHLSFGSLALGATPWQTLLRVVLPTASPGIFSAAMIGFGRAVGETMIVLMATGNTPVMSGNIFEGLRTLSANIAVEMAESEVNSSHFRILFLSALVLFLFTFVFNTTAEVIRHRLRRKYGSL